MFLFRRFAPTIPIENSSLSGICSFRSHISEKMFLSLRDLLTAFAHPSPPAAGRGKAQKKNWRSSELGASFFRALRRERDSNPRKLSLQQFSRLPV